MKRTIRLLLCCLLLIICNQLLAQSDTDKNLIFSQSHGFYYAPFTLQVTSQVSGAKIRYTIDGTNPLNSGTTKELNSPASINIDPSITTGRDKAPGFIVTACAVSNDTLISKVVSQTYLFLNKITELSTDNQVPGSGWLVPGTSGQEISYGLDPDVYNNSLYSSYIEKAFTSIPTLSIVTDLRNLFSPDFGIYVNALQHSEEWERAVSLELLNPDSSKGFQINCGLRIRGGWSRHNDSPKHAFRIFFRKEYGESKLKYPLFGDKGTDEFDKFDIQTSQNYSWAFYGDASNTFLRELFSRDTQRDMQEPYTHGKFYHLYINGSYFGLYQIQERAEASYGASYFGGDREDYDVIKVNTGVDYNFYDIEATDGNDEKWHELWLAAQNGFSSDENYYKVQGLKTDGTVDPASPKLLDVDNLIDYMIITFFVGDFDAPVTNFRSNYDPNNFYAIFNRVNPDGFKFFRHDAEHSMGVNGTTTIDRTGPFPAGNTYTKSNPQWLHQRLCGNPHYVQRFTDRVYKHFFYGGALTEQKNIERINKRKQEIETAIIAESARWGDSKTSTPLTKADWINAVNFITNDYLPVRNEIVLQQLISKGLFTDFQPPQFNLKGGVVDKGFNVTLSSGYGKIYYTDDGSDPCSIYPDPTGNFSKTVVAPSALKKAIVPDKEISTSWKSDIVFDDSGWLVCSGTPGGIGFEAGSGGYESYLSLSLQQYMFQGAANPNNSCYIRIPFDIPADDLAKITYMTLKIMVDDGFVAYINGTRVAQYNQPDNLAWNSAAPSPVESSGYTDFSLSNYISLLKPGENLLAIQGLNSSTSSSDFLILPQLIVGKSSTITGTVSPAAIEYNSAIPISKTTTIKTRAVTGSTWTPLTEANFIIREDLSRVRVTEINYHPLPQDTIDDKNFEFIELKNCGNEDVILTGAKFINGIDYIFPEKTVSPGGFVVLAANKNLFNNRYGFLPDDIYSGQFDNSGEKVTFVDAAGDTVFSFKYNDKAPWPVEADGQGHTLVSKSVNGIGIPDSSDYWLKSGSVNGSPGKDDTVSDVSDHNNTIVNSFQLLQNYPNPFNPVTVISYTIPVGTRPGVFVHLKVYDILGREVASLVNKAQKAGTYKISFNAGNFSSGVYFYKLTAGEYSAVRKMVVIK